MEKKDYKTLLGFSYDHNNEPVVNFLPYEDHFPKGYRVRNWYLSDDCRDLVYQVDKLQKGQMRPTIWLNGEIRGRWEIKWQDKKKLKAKVDIVDLNPNLNLPAFIKNMISDQREELTVFINKQLIPLMNRKIK